MDTIQEPARNVPIVHTADICVIGGSCTGVFAAVRAARLGADVAIIENNGFFGGVATAGLVNVWHSLHDAAQEDQIIGGLTAETIERLESRDAVCRVNGQASAYILNTEELKIELDALVCEARVRPFLHSRFVAPVVDPSGTIAAAVIEDKSGRRAIRAKYFVDATGDGDVIHRMGLETLSRDNMQPPTACALFEGLAKVSQANRGFNLSKEVFEPSYAEALARGFLWSSHVVGSDDLTMVAGTRVNNVDCSDADELTRAEIEGRQQVRRMLDVLRNHVAQGRQVFIRGLPAYIGVRETRHARCLHRLTEDELLHGRRFEDAVANGSYRIDIHHDDKPGITLRYLDGREDYVVSGKPPVCGRWRPEGENWARFYQIPLRSLIPYEGRNVIVAGRLIDADRGAYGAIRVMVNCNQTGEAAGVACVQALDRDIEFQSLDPQQVRRQLAAGGSIVV